MWAQTKYFEKRSKSMTDEPRIVFIGDSITNGLSVESIFNAVNFGISGYTVKRMKGLVGKYSNLEEKIIVLALGINDIPRNNSELIADYVELIENLPTNSTILISSILPRDEKTFFKYWGVKKTNSQISKINKMLLEYSLTKENIYYSDTAKFLRNDNGDLIVNFHIGDGIHLSEEGYKQWVNGLKNPLLDISR